MWLPMQASRTSGLWQGRVLLTSTTTIKVRDALMVCVQAGHTSLAQRSEVMLSIKASKHAAAPCSNKQCVGGGACRGNRYEVHPATGALMMILPHHKTVAMGKAGNTLYIQVWGWVMVLMLSAWLLDTPPRHPSPSAH